MSVAAVSSTARLTMHRTIASMRATRKSWDHGLTVGLVPTMGALHKGHLSLVRQAREENDVVVASIFVNPTQFGKGEDLDRYPRQLERDSELLADMGVDHLFAPDTESMYGPNHVTFVDPVGFDGLAEGRSRPGHFRGVATVVTKLFHIVQPTRAYFGQKDAAQCCLIRRIVKDLDLDVQVRVMDTIREPDGLAMSSRNAYLTPAERAAAPILYQSLLAAKQEQQNNNAETLRQTIVRVLQSEPLVSNIQYVSIDDKDTMKPIQQVGKDGAIVSIACQVGNVRLIDNIVL